MIIIATMTRSMLLASALVTAAVGGAWASQPVQEAVQAQIAALANAAIASANVNRCENAAEYSAKIGALLKNANIDISASNAGHTQVESEIQNKVITVLWSIQACEMRASASTTAPQATPSHVTPSTASSGTDTLQAAIAARKRGDIKTGNAMLLAFAEQGNPDAQALYGDIFAEIGPSSP